MTTRGSMGWLFLVIALAVPGVMFYHWWSNLNTERKKEMTDKIRTRLPEGGLFGGQGTNPEKLVNPIVDGAPPVSAAAAGPASTATAKSAEVLPSTIAAQVQTPAVATGANASNTAAAPEPVQPAGDEKAPMLASAAGNTPEADDGAVVDPTAGGEEEESAENLSGRDPTLSPYDYFKLEQIELEKMIMQTEVKIIPRDAPVRRVKRVIRLTPIHRVVQLQGIISTDQGKKAIVNDEMYSTGDVFMIGKREVKIIKIAVEKVYFQHKKKRFSKSLIE